VHIKRAGALDDNIHPDLPDRTAATIVARQEPRRLSNLKGGLTGTSPGFRARLPRQTLNGLTGTKNNGGGGKRPAKDRSFSSALGGRQAMTTLTSTRR